MAEGSKTHSPDEIDLTCFFSEHRELYCKDSTIHVHGGSEWRTECTDDNELDPFKVGRDI